jgi:hypothetical protein
MDQTSNLSSRVFAVWVAFVLAGFALLALALGVL